MRRRMFCSEATERSDEMRMTHARSAIRECLNDMTNPEDTVALASFNTFFTLHEAPTKKKLDVFNALDDISRPERAAAYTELYAAVDRAVFGISVSEANPAFLIAFLAALASFFGLTRLRFENRTTDATLEVLDAGGGKTATRVMTLSDTETVIGGNADADLTIVGARELKQDHTTDGYKLVTNDVVRVNNKPTKNRDLEAGDVLNVGGTIIVFDDTREAEKQ